MTDTDNKNGNKAGLIIFFLVQYLLIIPLFMIVPAFVFFTALAYSRENGLYTIPALVIIILGFIYMALSIIFCIRRKSKKTGDSAGKTIRYILSAMRFPGFWGASAASGKEKSADRRAVCVFVLWLVSATVLFFTLWGFVGLKDAAQYRTDSIHLLNGEICYKPEFPSSLNETRLIVNSDGSAYGLVTNNTELMKGPVIEEHVKNFHPSDDNELAFAYTFAPGSVASLNITSSSQMRVYYKKNDTVEMKNELVSHFELSITETAFTSYLVRITSPNSATLVTYDFVAETMVFDTKRAIYIGEDTQFEIRQGEYFVLGRNTTKCAHDEYLYVEVETAKYPEIWRQEKEWIYISLLIISILIVLQESLVVVLISQENPLNEKESKFKLLGHVSVFLVMLFGMMIFAIGASLYKSGPDPAKRTVFYTNPRIYSGEQFIIPVNYTEDLTIYFTTFSSGQDLRLSALRKIPDSSSVQAINCTPGPFLFNHTWSADYYISQNYSLDWYVETSNPFILTLSDSNGTVIYREVNENVSKTELIVNNTDVYTLLINSTVFEQDNMTFHWLILNAPMYNLSESVDWSITTDVSDEDLNSLVKCVAVEPAKPNITNQPFVVGLQIPGYPDPTVQKAFTIALTFAILFGILCVICIILFILDLFGKQLPICYVCSGRDSRVDEQNSEASGLIHTDGHDQA